MGALSGMFGAAGGVNGTGIAGPAGANIQNPTTPGQIRSAYTGVQNSFQQQQNLLTALQQQQGLQKQNTVYNQLQDVAAGRGPNPAMAQLNQATGQNVANQAALMAGQRGASNNVGLMARQAAQQGAATQQQAVGQGAVLQANQSLNALNQSGGLANTMATNQIGQANANAQARQNEQQLILNAQQGFNTNQVANQSSVNAGNTALANTQMQGQQAGVGGVMNALPVLAAALAEGGDAMAPIAPAGPQSTFGQFLKAAVSKPADSPQESYDYGNPGANQLAKGTTSGLKGLFSMMGPKAPGGTPYAGSFGDAAAMPTAMVAAGGGMAKDYTSGGGVKAKGASQKASVQGNSYANDKIPAVLSEHEIVIPRNITMGQNPVAEAAKFVAATLQKRRGK